jgi:hypothetical protein
VEIRTSMAKKQKVGDDKMNKDIISKLPTNLIESILERISIHEAARTSILSKNWRYIWASRRDLVLDRPFFFEHNTEQKEKCRPIL